MIEMGGSEQSADQIRSEQSSLVQYLCLRYKVHIEFEDFVVKHLCEVPGQLLHA